jgi:hypothetical protein
VPSLTERSLLLVPSRPDSYVLELSAHEGGLLLRGAVKDSRRRILRPAARPISTLRQLSEVVLGFLKPPPNSCSSISSVGKLVEDFIVVPIKGG